MNSSKVVDVTILKTIFLDAIFPIIYSLARSFIPFRCEDCDNLFPLHFSHGCQQLSDEEVHLKAVKLASVQLQQHLLEFFCNVKDILKRNEGGARYMDVRLVDFLSYFFGEDGNNAPNILTQLPLRTDLIEAIADRMLTHERNGGGPDLVLPEEMTRDYWAPDEYSSDSEREDNDSDKSIFGDL